MWEEKVDERDLVWELGNDHPDHDGSHKPHVATEHVTVGVAGTELYRKCPSRC